MTATSTRDRPLTPTEKDDRTQVLLSLLDEQEKIRFRVRASRDELREWRVEARNLAVRIDQVCSEIRTGIVTESAQPELPHMERPIPSNGHTVQRYGVSTLAALTREAEASVALDHDPDCGTRVCEGIDGSSDEPDPETDPPDPFFALYPPVRTHHELRDRLYRALTAAEYAKLGPDSVETWHPDTGIFQGIDWWCRVEIAHEDSRKRPPIAGLTIPRRGEMPGPLQQALAASQPKKKAPRKKPTTRKAKP